MDELPKTTACKLLKFVMSDAMNEERGLIISETIQKPSLASTEK